MEPTHRPTKDSRRKKLVPKKKLLIRFNRKKLTKTFAGHKSKSKFSPKNSTHEFEYFAACSAKSFDWKEKTREEIETMKKEVQRKALEGLEKFCFPDKPEPNRIFRRNNKMEKDKADVEEMWIFSAKKCPVHSLGKKTQEKTFWKSPISFLPLDNNHQNMLWRSFNHIKSFDEENYVDVGQISQALDLQKLSDKNALDLATDCFFGRNERRKARLSGWAFLRHDDSRQAKAGPKQGKPSETDSGRADVRGGDRARWTDVEESSGNGEPCDCSCCSCEKRVDDLAENPPVDVTQQLRETKMAPNSEEDAQITFQNKRSWGMDFAEKESLRPPVYNPEDYATSLKKWGRKPNAGMQLPLYLSQSTGSIDRISAELSLQHKKQSSPSTKSSSSVKSGDSKKEKELTLKVEKKDLKNKENINRGLKNELLKDFRNPISAFAANEGEMSLRQFSSVTELLGKLKVDLKLSFPSFVQEFVGDPVDGVTLLLELLRAVQLSQASQQQRCPPQVLRRALLDEHSCLVCLKHCLRCSDATRRLASSPAGLFTLAVCIMNNVTQTRIIALELLTKACEPPANGHRAVSEALSTLRLRFGEPVRFRFLVGMLNSAGAVELLAAAMKFINIFLETASSIQQKVYIQAELEQAGFDSKILKRTLPCNSESVKIELNKWDKNYFDVEVLQNKVVEVNALQEKIQILEKRIQILQEEKGILQSLEQCLKERCSELEEEVSTKTTTTTKSCPSKQFRAYTVQQNNRNTEKGESTPAEDEGISSSEQELSQDEDYVKSAVSYNSNEFEQMKNANESGNETKRFLNKSPETKIAATAALKNFRKIISNKMKETNVDDGNEIVSPMDGESNEGEEGEEETTIDDVIEELENIVNDAETQVYANEEKLKPVDLKAKPPAGHPKRAPDCIAEDKYRTYTRFDNFEESEIIPSMLHPQPPRKAKSLVHIYFPGRDFDSHDHVKSEFFDEDTDSETSDSLLTAAREKKSVHKTCHRSLEVSDSFNSFSSVNTRTLFIKQEEEYEDSELNIKLGYEERNIDEEEIKRKHLKNKPQYKPEKKLPDVPVPVVYKDKKPVESNKKPGLSHERFNDTLSGSSFFEKTTSFQGIKSCIADAVLSESPFTRSPKVVPTPVKRSQTFHITTSDGERPYRRSEIKPKPKMGVSGLDFQRSAEQKEKNDHKKYQSVEYKKNSDRRVDGNDRYSKRVFRDAQKSPDSDEAALSRRGSFDGLLFTVEPKGKWLNKINKPEDPIPGLYTDPSPGLDKSHSKRSKSLEKMDEGLDSLVDIVISPDEIKKPKPKNEWNIDVSKNIGPRTRRSLAESSLFTPPFPKNADKAEEPSKPPKPAQRTSLTRNNSSSTPLHLPIEIKLAPVQPKEQQQFIYNFGLKPSKSEDSLSGANPAKRHPPDGASSPINIKKNIHENAKFPEDKSPIYSIPLKQSKLQKFFGNPKFENSTGMDATSNQKYFENNYACAGASSEKSISPMPRSIQNMANTTSQRVKNLIISSNQQKVQSNKTPDGQPQSRPNFLLGTYQSQASKNTSPKPVGNSSVLNSINNFNNSFLMKRGNSNNKIQSGARKNSSDYSPGKSEKPSGNVSNRQLSSGAGVGSEKVTDSPSGLY